MSLADNKQYILIGIGLIAGIGFCIGGIFVPPLLIPGGLLITGSLGALAGVVAKKVSSGQSSPRAENNPSTPDIIGGRERSPSITISIDNRSVTFTPHFDGNGFIRRPPTPMPNLEEQQHHRLTLV